MMIRTSPLSIISVLLLTLVPVQPWTKPSNRKSTTSLHVQPTGALRSLRYERILSLPNGECLDVISRTISITTTWNVTIWEKHNPADIMEQYHWDNNKNSNDSDNRHDPFGLVNWPGSVVAARELLRYQTQIQNKTVLVLGAGTGLEAQAVAMLGASKVIATDIFPMTLNLLHYGAEQAGLANIISSSLFDLFGTTKIPDCDVVVAADVLYSPELAMQLGKRLTQILLTWDPPPLVLVTDSQRFHGTDFCPTLRQALTDKSLEWEERTLEQFTGSGVMVNEDQTYHVKARVLAIGFHNT